MSVTIREAILDDLPALARIGRKFYEEAELPGEYSEAQFVRSWTFLLGRGVGVILMAENGDGPPVGAVAALASPSLYVEGRTCLDEAFWYVDPDRRGGMTAMRLFRAMEDFAKSSGVHDQGFVHLEKLQPATLKEVYERRGFKMVETHYRKELQ